MVDLLKPKIKKIFINKKFVGFSIILVVFVIFYMFLLGSTVYNIVEKKIYEKKISALENEIADLEIQFLKISEKLNLESAKEIGLAEPKNITYTLRTFTAKKESNYNEI